MSSTKKGFSCHPKPPRRGKHLLKIWTVKNITKTNRKGFTLEEKFEEGRG